MRRRRREREIPDYAAFARRAVRAYGRRVADADPEDLVELVALAGVLDAAVDEAVRGLRRRDGRQASWSEIGRALGITRQAAQQRYSEPSPARPRTMPGEVELPLAI